MSLWILSTEFFRSFFCLYVTFVTRAYCLLSCLLFKLTLCFVFHGCLFCYHHSDPSGVINVHHITASDASLKLNILCVCLGPRWGSSLGAMHSKEERLASPHQCLKMNGWRKEEINIEKMEWGGTQSWWYVGGQGAVSPWLVLLCFGQRWVWGKKRNILPSVLCY